MFKRILSLIQQDLANSLRDNIILYMIVAPVLLAVGASLFLPSIDRVSITIAVQEGLDSALIERLGQMGNVEVYQTIQAVEERVRRSDDVAGVVPDGSTYRVIFEGSEAEDAHGMLAVIDAATSGATRAEYIWTQVGTSRSLLNEYGTIILILIAILLGSVIMAFNIIEDKETRAIRAMGVSPLSMLELTLARGLFAAGLSYLLIVLSVAIMIGARVNYAMLTVGFLCSLGLPVLIGYTIGGLADSQLKAIAILKFLMLVYMTLPIITIFIPRSAHIFFYILPNYWMWTVFENIFIGQLGPVGFWEACAITLGLSISLIAATMPFLRRQLKLR